MSKINGTDIVVYADGSLIAAQRGGTINFNQDLSDATNKDSLGWAEHKNGLRGASVDFDALYSTTGISGDELAAYITSRSKVMVVVETDGSPFVMEASLESFTVDSPVEDLVGISGTFIAHGAAYHLSGDYAQLNSSWTNISYDTFTSTGTQITSAITDGSTFAYADGGSLTVVVGTVIKVVFFLTLNSGVAPGVEIANSGGGQSSNTEVSVAGVNIITLTATAGGGGEYLLFRNEAGDVSNFSTSNVYVFEV